MTQLEGLRPQVKYKPLAKSPASPRSWYYLRSPGPRPVLQPLQCVPCQASGTRCVMQNTPNEGPALCLAFPDSVNISVTMEVTVLMIFQDQSRAPSLQVMPGSREPQSIDSCPFAGGDNKKQDDM